MDLHVKYRPKDFESVVGHKDTVRSLSRALGKGLGKAILFTGPSGVGKTTLARIVASQIGCPEEGVQEIDAATHTGVDAMRGLMESLQFKGLGESGQKFVIIDECHALSASAWQSLLKMVEEPPSHVSWCFCTTEASKVPKTIRTRCLIYDLQPIGVEELFPLLKMVDELEELKLPEEVLYLCAEASEGSPRKALTSLAKVLGAKNRKVAARILKEAQSEDDEVIKLCRALTKPISWSQAMALLAGLEGKNPESIRIQVVAYMTSVAKGAKEPGRAAGILNIIDAFASPYPPTPLQYPLLMSLGKVVFEAGE